MSPPMGVFYAYDNVHLLFMNMGKNVIIHIKHWPKKNLVYLQGAFYSKKVSSLTMGHIKKKQKSGLHQLT
jgi:hypothetical protein